MTSYVGAWAPHWVSGHQFQIDLNPIELTFFRSTRARQTGGGHGFDPWVSVELGTFRVRVHQQGRGSTQVSDVLTGHQERDSTWGLITGPDVPLRVTDGQDDNVRVMFAHPIHGSFRLRRLRALEGGGQFLGWQSDLERISHTGPQPQPAASGRKRLEDDPDHPWRDIVARAEELRAAGPRLSWGQIASRLNVTEERLGEYRRRVQKAEKDPDLATPPTVRVRPSG